MNLPNKITLCRICLIPLFVFFFLADFVPYGKLIAAFLFATACFTDFLDGNIARKRGLVTNMGKFLDPIADKVLVMAGLIVAIACPITANGGVNPAQPILGPSWVGIVAVVIILAREFVVSAFRQIAATKKLVLAADMYGKVKAVFQFITLIYYFVYAFIVEEFYYAIAGTANTVLGIVGYVFLAITVILTIISGIKYIVGNRQVFKDEPKEETK
ncbi:MAG: CDP-alcohol phosphatidyltransferase family protein [Clostridia bacterium]|nr:CDP-alcohol phosphatidyltransferase family protein [Clostridia bacterium]